MPKLTHKKLVDVLDYSKETGVFKWKKRTSNRVCVGDIAGASHSKDGYIQIYISGEKFYAHRLAWFYVNREWPVGSIDHMNVNRRDNRISNLRILSKQENAQNVFKATTRSKTGLLGVGVSTSGNYVAQIRYGGKLHYLGVYKTPEDAHKVYMEHKLKHHYGYNRTNTDAAAIERADKL